MATWWTGAFRAYASPYCPIGIALKRAASSRGTGAKSPARREDMPGWLRPEPAAYWLRWFSA